MIYLKVSAAEYIWGVWKVDETNDELLAQLQNIKELNTTVLNLGFETRIRERLAVRVLLKALIGEETTIYYHQSGKPYLKDLGLNLSVSHTDGYVAVCLHSKKAVGIDIEQISDKVKRVRDRFVSPKEYINPDNELIHLLVHWSAKETMYKALDCEGLNFRDDLMLEKFEPKAKGHIVGHLVIGNRQRFQLSYIVDQNFVLTMLI